MTRICQHCGRKFNDFAAVRSHHEAKHKSLAFQQAPDHDDSDPSYAEMSIGASIRRRMGERLGSYESWLADMADGK